MSEFGNGFLLATVLYTVAFGFAYYKKWLVLG